jgi:hypothetical protein
MKLVAPKRFSLAILAVAVIAILSALPARADEWSKTYTISGKPDLRVETSDANIRVTTWDQNTIEAKVMTSRYKIGEDGIRVSEHQNGDVVEIEVRYPHHNFTVEWGQHKVDIGRQFARNFDRNVAVAGLEPPARGQRRSGVRAHFEVSIARLELEFIEAAVGGDVSIAGLGVQLAVDAVQVFGAVAAVQVHVALEIGELDLAVAGAQIDAAFARHQDNDINPM